MEEGLRDYAANFKDLIEVSLRVPCPSRRQDHGLSQQLCLPSHIQNSESKSIATHIKYKKK